MGSELEPELSARARKLAHEWLAENIYPQGLPCEPRSDEQFHALRCATLTMAFYEAIEADRASRSLSPESSPPGEALERIVTAVGRCPACDAFPSEWCSPGMDCSECGAALLTRITVDEDGCDHWSFTFEYQEDAERVAAERAAPPTEREPG